MLYLFDQKYSKNSNIVKYYNEKHLCFNIEHFPMMAKLNFQHYSSPQCHMIMSHDLFSIQRMSEKKYFKN